MELTGKIIEVLPTQEGAGKNGIWKKQQIIIEHHQVAADYSTPTHTPRKVCITLWGDLTGQVGIEGMQVEANCHVESRQSAGRWYTEVKAWKFKLLGMFLFMSLFGCNDDSRQKAYLGEWNKLESSYFIYRWVFTESDGKLHARHIKQRVEKYKGIESEYACDTDEKGNVVIHTGIDIKGNISEGKLYLMGETYQKLRE